MRARSVILSCLLLMCMFATAQQNLNFQQANALFGSQRILKYRTFSLDLQDQSKQELDRLVTQIRISPGIIKSNILILQIFTCEKELLVKPYIGVVRAQRIIDYLEKELGLARKKCLIQDNGASQFDKNCEIGSGLNIYLKPGFYE